MKRIVPISALAALCIATVPAQAAPILFSNFDSITSPLFATQGYANFATADGWTGGDSLIEVQNNGVAGAPFSSPNLVELDTFENSKMMLAIGAGTYRVSYWYSPRPTVVAASNTISLSVGSTLLDSVTGAGGIGTLWQSRVVLFTTSGGLLTFRALGTSDSLGGYLDNIRVATVPEPTIWASMVIGFGLVGAGMRRRQSANAVLA